MARRSRKLADEQILLALACGSTVEAACRQLGVGEATVYRRLADPAFRERLRALRADMVQRASGMLTAAAMESVKTLLDLQQKAVASAVRLGAARAVLEIGIKMRELTDVQERLAALEKRHGFSVAG
jgi:hypothetical protein